MQRSTKNHIFAFALGVVLILAAYVSILLHKSTDAQQVDLKCYYISAVALVHHANPYDNILLQRLSYVADPTGFPAGGMGEGLVNIPSSIVGFIPFTVLSWTVFRWLFVFGVAVCIPASMWLASSAFGMSLRPTQLLTVSLAAAAFPPVWRSVVVGQMTPFILVAMLASLMLAQRKKPVLACGAILAALAKATVSAPFSLLLFLKGDKHLRSALAASLIILFLINVILAMTIGLKTFERTYSTNVSGTFGTGGVNDPQDSGQVRIDVEPLVDRFVTARGAHAVNAIVLALLAATAVVLILRKNTPIGIEVTVVLLLSLLIAYHRPYDACLALPLFLIAGFFEPERRTARFCRIAALLAAAAVLGDHNITALLGPHAAMAQSALIRPLITLTLYFSVVVPEMFTERGIRVTAADAYKREADTVTVN